MYTSGPPIHKLSQDILHYIFLANADEADIIPSAPQETWYEPDSPERPLITTRWSSQVCRGWREITLNSASLWGRLLDLDGLQQQNPQWREEVLRRAGSTTPLWVSRTEQTDPDEPTLPALKEFLFRILDAHWERVEILFVRLRVGDVITWMAGSPTITLPAPALRRFALLPPFFMDVRNRFLVPSMFSNNAPRLETFLAPILHFLSESSRFSSLRSLTTSFPPDFSTLTSAISYMPFLEDLSIFPSPGPPFVQELDLARLLQSTPQINLPRLKEMTLEGSFSACLLLASAIQPAVGCTLDFQGRHATNQTVSGSVLTTLSRVFNKYFTGFLDRYHAPAAICSFNVHVTE